LHSDGLFTFAHALRCACVAGHQNWDLRARYLGLARTIYMIYTHAVYIWFSWQGYVKYTVIYGTHIYIYIRYHTWQIH
jgi:hypothetical protein